MQQAEALGRFRLCFEGLGFVPVWFRILLKDPRELHWLIYRLDQGHIGLKVLEVFGFRVKVRDPETLPKPRPPADLAEDCLPKLQGLFIYIYMYILNPKPHIYIYIYGLSSLTPC